MRKIIASVNITLDGFMADKDGGLGWHFNYWDNQLGEALCRQLYEADTLLLGGNTYRAFAGYWPFIANNLNGAREDLIIAELLNNCTKVVVSETIAGDAWPDTIILKGKLADKIKLLKTQPGKDLIVLGSRQLLMALARLNLIDRYELWVHPVTIGKGKALFNAANPPALQLLQTRQLDSGVVHLSYNCNQP
jgi:dihydrofolate reductase